MSTATPEEHQERHVKCPVLHKDVIITRTRPIYEGSPIGPWQMTDCNSKIECGVQHEEPHGFVTSWDKCPIFQEYH